MQIGLDSFVATLADPVTGALVDPVVRLGNLLEEVETADRVGLDVFGIGEHHRGEFLDSAPVVLLAAAAARAIAWKHPHGALIAIDFKTAFPSISQSWILKNARAGQFPSMGLQYCESINV